jgi:hypothetical protein
MNTPFQHFITVAQRVFENVSIDQPMSDLTKSISWINTTQTSSSLVFGNYPYTCKIHLVLLNGGDINASCEFSCPLDSDASEFDTLFEVWVASVDQFLASDSPLLIDNQIKKHLRK